MCKGSNQNQDGGGGAYQNGFVPLRHADEQRPIARTIFRPKVSRCDANSGTVSCAGDAPCERLSTARLPPATVPSADSGLVRCSSFVIVVASLVGPALPAATRGAG